MTQRSVRSIVRHLQELKEQAAPGDQELLRRFIHHKDEAAFAAIVRRHGPLVRDACRRLLGQDSDADDAFQATFLVLLRKAHAIRKRQSLGSWLYGVAFRIAAQAKRERARRERGDRVTKERCADDPGKEAAWRELCALLDAEVYRLSEAYRSPVVLCHLQGRTRDEAAQELGLSLRTLERRLERARELLRQRLTRRGVTLSGAFLAAALAPATGKAAIPAVWNTGVGLAVSAYLKGKAPLASKAAALADGVLQGMTLLRATVLMMVSLTLVTVGAGAGLVVRQVLTTAGLQAAGPQPAPSQDQNPLATPRETHADRLDRYGDPLPPGTIARLGTVRFRPGKAIGQIAYSPDGKLVALASVNMEVDGKLNDISIWDPATGRQLRQFGGQREQFLALAFSPDGKLVATQGSMTEGAIRLWETATGRQLRQITQKAAGFSNDTAKGQEIVGIGLAFSPDGKILATRGADGAIHLWDIATGNDVLKIPSLGKDLTPLVFSRDGRILAIASHGAIQLCEAATGQEVIRLTGHEGLAGTAAFSSDQKTLAAIARTPGQLHEKTVYLWELTTGRLIQQFSLGASPVFSGSFSPDGSTLLAGGYYNGLRLFDVTTGKKLRDLVVPFDEAVLSAAFSPNGRTVTAGGGSRVLHFWDVASGKLLPAPSGHDGIIRSIALSHDGRMLASVASDHCIRLWDLSTGESQLLATSATRPFGVGAFMSDDRALVASSRGFVGLLQVPSGAVARSFGKPSMEHGPVALSPDARTLAEGGTDGTIRLWELSSGKLCRELVFPHEEKDAHQQLLCLAFSPDGKLLAAGGYSSTSAVWEVATGKLRHKLPGHKYLISQVSFSPDGKTLVTTNWNQTIRLWETLTGRQRSRFEDPGKPCAVAFSPDGRILASGGTDTIIRLRDLATEQEVARFEGHLNTIGRLVFSDRGDMLASGGWDTTILTWNLKEIRRAHTPRTPLADKDMQALWIDLAVDDSLRAYRAIQQLIQLPQQAVPLLGKHLRPAAPLSGAVEEHVRSLVADLDHDRFAVRRNAAEELGKLGCQDVPTLKKQLEVTSQPEGRRRLEALLEKLDREGPRADELRDLRALEVLEYIGTAAARELLKKLAEGAPEARLTQESNSALERLAKRGQSGS